MSSGKSSGKWSPSRPGGLGGGSPPGSSWGSGGRQPPTDHLLLPVFWSLRLRARLHLGPGYTWVQGKPWSRVEPGPGHTRVYPGLVYSGGSVKSPSPLHPGPGNRRFEGSQRPPAAKPTGKGGGLRPTPFPVSFGGGEGQNPRFLGPGVIFSLLISEGKQSKNNGTGRTLPSGPLLAGLGRAGRRAVAQPDRRARRGASGRAFE